AAVMAPAIAAAELPRPPATGIALSSAMRDTNRFVAAPRRTRCAARRARLRPVRGRRSRPSPRTTTAGSTGRGTTSSVTVLCRSSARPRQSNPGPRLALVAGTRAMARLISFVGPAAGDLGHGGGSGARGAAAPRALQSGFEPLDLLLDLVKLATEGHERGAEDGIGVG